MTEHLHPAASQNPFSTRHVRPGAIPYVFPPGRSSTGLLERLRGNGWRGQVVGPHGSGKSALLATLIAAIEQTGRNTLLIELHDGQRRLPLDLRRTPQLTPGTVLIVDGYEQLALWSRFLLRRACRRRGLGLVVTAHTSVGFPDLFRTTTSLPLVRKIVEQLLGDEASLITPAEVSGRFRQHEGDLREVLFDLYDLYEQRRRKGSNDSTAGTA